MDRMLYVAMNGAKQNMMAQVANSNNLANVSTPGFREDVVSFRSMPIFGLGHPTRAYGMAERPGVNLEPGILNTTDNPMDIAVDGKGYIAVQSADGTEAYTRAGNLRVTAAGILLSGKGDPVIGNAGPISLPPASRVEIATNGTISIIPLGAENEEFQEINRIKLVNPPEDNLYKSNDGLIRLKEGDFSPANANVRVVSRTVENSNVNITDALVNMIQLSREFEFHVKMMREADKQAEKISQLMRIS
ncbi:MAG: flagellar basal body rod protein FlgF [Gammaproteobacteria bacterium]|nr:flagellar basal body rod protein FlgF [Gammaproteobacteria bacterium]